MASPASSRPRDLTQGPIGRTLLAFALPTLGANVLQSLNASINTIWVGRFLGENALAATSNANLVLFLTLGAVFGFGMAATILVGQSVGRRDLDTARRVMGSTLGMFMIAGLAVTVAGWFAAPAILRGLATPAAAQPLAVAYLRMIFLGMPSGLLMTLLTMGLRGTGDSMTPLRLMILNVLLDAGLNPVLILGLGPAPRLGIAGAGLATTIASTVTMAVLIAIIYARDLPIRLRGAEWRYLRPDPALLRLVVGKGLPMGAQMIVITASALALIGLVNRAGVVTTAAYGVATQLWSYIQMPAFAIGAAVSAMVAQSIGAGRWDRVDAVTRAGIIANLVLTGATILVLLLVDRQVMALFLGANSPAVDVARHIQLVASWSFLPFGITMVIFGTVRANGAVVPPLVILAVVMFPVRFGIALPLLPHIGVDAVWWSLPAGSTVAMLLAILYYRSGHWRARALMAGPAAPATPPTSDMAEADCDPANRTHPIVTGEAASPTR